MRQAYYRLVQLFSRINLICAIAGTAILSFVGAIIFIEVISRKMFGSSRLWVIEISEYSLLFITLLGAPYLLEKNRHVMLDLLYNRFLGTSRLLAVLFNSTLGMAICLIMTVAGIGVVIDQIQSGVRETTVLAPQRFWITAAVPIGMFLMAFEFFRQAVDALIDRKD
ncbi:MAG: TRAP transporter small permease [Qingshengfaniella sp.]